MFQHPIYLMKPSDHTALCSRIMRIFLFCHEDRSRARACAWE